MSIFEKIKSCLLLIMRIIAQRVLDASVTVGDKIISSIGKGLLILVGFTKGDNKDIIKDFASKTVNMRLWQSEGKAWASSVKDINGEILVVSQFTLYGYFKGNKPDFHDALGANQARQFYQIYVEMLRNMIPSQKVQTGQFQTMMVVRSANQGPVTLLHSREQQVQEVIEAKKQEKKQKNQGKKKEVHKKPDSNQENQIEKCSEQQKISEEVKTNPDDENKK